MLHSSKMSFENFYLRTVFQSHFSAQDQISQKIRILKTHLATKFFQKNLVARRVLRISAGSVMSLDFLSACSNFSKENGRIQQEDKFSQFLDPPAQISLKKVVQSSYGRIQQQDEQCVAVRCSVLQCVAVCCSVLQSCSGRIQQQDEQCVAVRCSVLQCVAVCCSVLQCVAVCCSHVLVECSSKMSFENFYLRPGFESHFPKQRQISQKVSFIVMSQKNLVAR